MTYPGIGLALIVHPEGVRLSVLMGFNVFLDHLDPMIFGLMLIAVSIPAAFALLLENRLTRKTILSLIFLQYVILLAAFLSEAYLLVTREFQETNFNFWDGFQALWPTITASGLHALAVLERYGYRWYQKPVIEVSDAFKQEDNKWMHP